MHTTISKIHGLHYLEDQAGAVLRTPAGHPIGCFSEETLKIVAGEVTQFSMVPTDSISLFGLFCTYLDFDTPKSDLISSLITALEDDVAYLELAMAVTMGDVDTKDEEVLGSPYPEEFLRRSGFYTHFEIEMEGSSGAINYQKLVDWLLGQLESATSRQLACLHYCAANLQCLLPTLALLSSNYSTENFKALVADNTDEREATVIDHLRTFASLPEDRDAIITNFESSTV